MNRSSGWKLAFSRWRDLSDATRRAHWLQALKDCLTRAGHILASDEDLFYAFYGHLFRPIAMAIAGDVGRSRAASHGVGTPRAHRAARHRPPGCPATAALLRRSGTQWRQLLPAIRQRAHPCKSAGRTCEPEKSPAMASMTRGSALAPESPPCGRTQPQNRKPA